MSSKCVFINGKRNQYAYKEYLCDSEEDIAKLPRIGIKGTMEVENGDNTTNEPCSVGSLALVCLGDGNSIPYILRPSNEWVKL